MAQPRNQKFNEEHIKKLMQYAKHNLLKPPYTNKYNAAEIEEAKKRIELEKAMKPTVIDNLITNLFGNAKKSENHEHQKTEDDQKSECRLM